MVRFILLIFIFLILTTGSQAQELSAGDTALFKADTSLVKPADTTSASGVDTVVTYSCADSIIFTIDTKTMSLHKKGDIKYQTMALQAERIDVDWSTSIMTATGTIDSSDTAKSLERGMPVMKDGGDVYHGKELGYNFRTKRGRIHVADTKMDQGYYHGEQLKKMGKDVLFVADGRYTTCDSSCPHYYFYSPKMKVTLGDKVFAEPIYLYLADVPVFWFPVAVFPNKGGRRSGIIAPAIAEDATHGRMLRHIGYYWAISDYMDLSLKTDLYTKGSWALFSSYRYSLRYNFSGSMTGEYRKFIEGETSDAGRKEDASYNVRISHRQEINPTTRFDVDFTFASNNSYRNTIDINQALRQEISSNATISKHWEGTPNSVSLNVSRRQNLIDGNSSEVLPSFRFNHSQSYPFRFKKKGYDDPSSLSWYEMIGISYNANFSNNRSKTKRTVNGVAASVGGVDTLVSVQEYERDRNLRLGQGVSMNIAPKVGVFTVSPYLSYSDDRGYTDNDIPDTTSGKLYLRNDRAWSRSGTIVSGISASTKVYGILQPDALGIAAFRHTITPNLSLSYSKQVVGERLAPKQMMMNFSVGNVFEMKMKPAQEGQEGTKIQLMNIGAGLSYNFSADSMRLSAVNVNYRTAIGSLLDIGGNMVFDPYKLEQINQNVYNRVNKFLLSEEGRLARMTSFSISLSTSLSGERTSSKSSSSDVTDSVTQMSAPDLLNPYSRDEDPDFNIPWRLSLSWDFSENKVPPSRSRSSNMRGNLEFNLTKNWKFSVSSGYDMMKREILVPQVVISRDLHCWIMNFSWVPIGIYRHYMFEIRLKAPQLQDIKVTKQGSPRGIY